MKIKFNSDDNLPLNKILMIHIVIISVFQEDGKYYPQISLRWMFIWIINARIL